MKTFFAVAALGAALVLPASFAQAQSAYGAGGYDNGYRAQFGDHPGGLGYDGLGSGTLINNSNCPAGTSPHVWPNGNGYRCFPTTNY